MKHSELIELLGGGTKVAERLGEISGEHVDREAIYKWRERDFIPWRWQPLVAQIARETRVNGKSVKVPEGFLTGVAA